MSAEAAMAAAVTVIEQMEKRHATLAGATEYVPGYEGIMTAVEQLVLATWLDLYRQLAAPTDQGQRTNDHA